MSLMRTKPQVVFNTSVASEVEKFCSMLIQKKVLLFRVSYRPSSGTWSVAVAEAEEKFQEVINWRRS